MPQRAIADPAFPTHRRRDLCGRGFPSGLAFFPAGASREGQGQGRAGNSQAGSSSQDGLPRGQGSAGGRLSPARRTACRRSRCVGRSPGPSRDGGRPPRCRRARAVPLSEGEEAIRRAALLLFLSVLLLPGLDGPSDYGCLWRKGDHGHPSQGGSRNGPNSRRLPCGSSRSNSGDSALTMASRCPLGWSTYPMGRSSMR